MKKIHLKLVPFLCSCLEKDFIAEPSALFCLCENFQFKNRVFSFMEAAVVYADMDSADLSFHSFTC